MIGNKKLTNNKLGTTLLELMVAVSIFALLIISATAIFKMVAEGQRNAIAAQNVQESLRYALEMMAKEVRSARESNDECRVALNLTDPAIYKLYNTNQANDFFYFKNKDDYCVAYYLDNDRLKVARVSGTAAEDYLTPAKIKINSLKFSIADNAIGAFKTIQPRVTVDLEAEMIGPETHKQNLKIQTTISSRLYE